MLGNILIILIELVKYEWIFRISERDWFIMKISHWKLSIVHFFPAVLRWYAGIENNHGYLPVKCEYVLFHEQFLISKWTYRVYCWIQRCKKTMPTSVLMSFTIEQFFSHSKEILLLCNLIAIVFFVYFSKIRLIKKVKSYSC